MIGYECTIGVEYLEAIAKGIEEHGGKITMQPMIIETVGTLLMFQNTEGNTVGAMRFEEGKA